MANVFEGPFPQRSAIADGWTGTCPVDEFEPNRSGLRNMIGNVWEWTADAFTSDVLGGVPTVRDDDANHDRTMKGGSYLCADNYCLRYRPAARTSQAVDTATCHIGFRCVRPLP